MNMFKFMTLQIIFINSCFAFAYDGMLIKQNINNNNNNDISDDKRKINTNSLHMFVIASKIKYDATSFINKKNVDNWFGKIVSFDIKYVSQYSYIYVSLPKIEQEYIDNRTTKQCMII